MTTSKTVHVAVIAIPEALPYSMMGPLDILRSSAALSAMAGDSGPVTAFEVDLVGETDAAFRSYNGVFVQPDRAISDTKKYDLVWIPSLMVGAQGLFDRHVNLVKWIKAQAASGAELASVCTGAFLLAETGLLNGKQATTHWAYADLFKQLYPRVELLPQLSMVENDRIRCAAAGAAWHDMVLAILEEKSGKRNALQAAKMFLLQYHHNGQKHLLPAPAVPSDGLMARAERWLLAHISEEQLIARVADETGLPESTFKRRFKQASGIPPNTWIQRMRIRKAQEALELTQKTVDEISLLVGYQDSSFFRRLFRRETGLSPAEYRRQFRT